MAESVPGRVPASGRAGRITTAPFPWVRPRNGANHYYRLEARIYDELCSWPNLLLAYRRASKGKRGQAGVATFEYRLEDNLLALQAELARYSFFGLCYLSGPAAAQTA